jgi:hypothetical protein
VSATNWKLCGGLPILDPEAQIEQSIPTEIWSLFFSNNISILSNIKYIYIYIIIYISLSLPRRACLSAAVLRGEAICIYIYVIYMYIYIIYMCVCDSVMLTFLFFMVHSTAINLSLLFCISVILGEKGFILADFGQTLDPPNW